MSLWEKIFGRREQTVIFHHSPAVKEMLEESRNNSELRGFMRGFSEKKQHYWTSQSGTTYRITKKPRPSYQKLS